MNENRGEGIKMEKQVIIAIGREFGSGGHVIGKEIAKRLELPFYDHNLLSQIAVENNMDHEILKQYDEKPRNRLFTRTVAGFGGSPEENVATLQFDYLLKMAREGKSFVVVGRCAESKLKKFPGLISVFILSDYEAKVERIKKLHQISEEEAKAEIKRGDWKRKSYHNYYCKAKWGDSRNYDISINSSKLGIEKTIDLLEQYIKERMKE